MALGRVIVIAGSTAMLTLSIYPGLLADSFYFLFFILVGLSPIWFPVFCIAGVVYFVRGRRLSTTKKLQNDPELLADKIDFEKALIRSGRRMHGASLILVSTLVLVYFNIPRRVAFIISLPAFDRVVSNATRWLDKTPNPRLGLYYVDSCLADDRGGVYIRTHQGPDGISPDVMSYGFVYRPNPEGTPFGRAGYQYAHVIGAWCSFRASSDYP